jgi:D-amino-acid dehydrogenase
MSGKIVIIGGGVIGLSCAHYLTKQGHKVIVIERTRLTDGCSFGNMGYISPSHFIPLATPGIVAQGLRWMMSSSSPFYIKPRLNWDLIRWGTTFYRNANAKKLSSSIPHLSNLLQLSRKLVNDLKSEVGDSFDLTENGCWMLYKNEKTGDHEKHLAEQAAEFNLKTITCTAAEVQQYEPEVEVNVAGGVLYLDDCYINPPVLMKALHTHLINAGVEFQLGAEVISFERNNQNIKAVITNQQRTEADEVIVANGSWMQELSKLLNIQLLLQPGKGYSFTYSDLEKNLHYPSILVDDRVATTPYDRSLRIGGTMELSGHSDNILPKRVTAIYNAFKKYYPAMDIHPPDTTKAWFGYRPVTPDGMPYIGRHHAFNNLIYAGGHAMLGVSAATGTGQLVSEIVDGRKTTIDIEAFDPARF